jgi:hypothetical protein
MSFEKSIRKKVNLIQKLPGMWKNIKASEVLKLIEGLERRTHLSQRSFALREIYIGR